MADHPALQLGLLVRLDWYDSRGCSPHWSFEGDLDTSVCVAKSAGWVIALNDGAVTISPHMVCDADPKRSQFCGDMTIPLCAIAGVQRLEVDNGAR